MQDTPPSAALEDAEEALRKMSRDLSAYRDPAVRRHLYAAPSPPAQSTPAQLQATIITLRTDLHDATESLAAARRDALEARKLSAGAQRRAAELSTLLDEKEREQADVVKSATDRIEALEKEFAFAKQAAGEREMLLQDTVERDRYGQAAVLTERDMFRERARERAERVESLEEEVRALKERAVVERREAERDAEAAAEQVDLLRETVEYLKTAKEGGGEEELREARKAAERLQRECAQVRSELATQSRENVAVKERLAETQSKVSEMRTALRGAAGDRKELKEIRREFDILKRDKAKFQSASHQIAALTREKEQLAGLIRKLSPTGDVQEGLRRLSSSARRGDFAGASGRDGQHGGAVVSGAGMASESHVVGNTAHEQVKDEEVAALKQRVRRTREELAAARDEVDEAKKTARRHERIRRILQHENACFKEALAKIERDLDEVPDASGMTRRLQDRCDAYEKSCEQYAVAVKEMEEALEDRRKWAEGPGAKVGRGHEGAVEPGGSRSPALDALKSQVSVGTKAAEAAVHAKGEMEQSVRKMGSRLSEVESGLERVKVWDGESEEELDYDPKVTKVLHVKENPLARAIAEAASTMQKASSKKRMRMEEMNQSGRAENEDGADVRVAALQKEVSELTAQNAELARSSKVGVRTGEIAKKKIEEVRAAVYNLFGWSMKVTGAKYTIASIYAESPRDFLEFGMNASGTMTLHETEYTHELAGEIEQYVQKMNSIPALLANVTIENFDKTTALV